MPFIYPAGVNWAFIAKSSVVLHINGAGSGLKNGLVAVVGIPCVASCITSSFIIRCLHLPIKASTSPVLTSRSFGTLIAYAQIEIVSTIHKGTS
jgi:hypothetical protein